MTIASEIEDLQTNLAAAKAAVTAKGGAVGNTGLAGLASEITAIPGGGGSMTCKTPYGRLWYAPFEETWNVDYANGCTVTIDSAKLSAYVATNPIQSWMPGEVQAQFDYNSGDGTWDSWSFQNPITSMTTADMATQLGITVVLAAGAEYPSFQVSLTVEPVVDAEWASVDLSSSELSEIKAGWYESSFTAGGKTIYCDYVRRFEFGTVEQKNLLNGPNDNYFLRNTGISEVSIIPDNIKGVARSPFTMDTPNFNCPLIFGPKIFAFSAQFSSGSTFNQPIIFDPDVPTAEEKTEYGLPWVSFSGTNGNAFLLNGALSGTRELFNSIIAIGDNVEGIDLYGMAIFNQPLTLPDGLKVLRFSQCDAFNRDLLLPQGLTLFQVFACKNYTSTINVGTLSPEIVPSAARTNMFGCENSTDPAYTQGIKIAGANRQAWLNMFPDKSSEGWAPYRHLVDAGY